MSVGLAVRLAVNFRCSKIRELSLKYQEKMRDLGNLAGYRTDGEPIRGDAVPLHPLGFIALRPQKLALPMSQYPGMMEPAGRRKGATLGSDSSRRVSARENW